MAACGSVAASSKPRLAGLSAQARSGALTYSANARVAELGHVPEDLVAHLEPRDTVADCLDPAGHVEAEAAICAACPARYPAS